MSSNNASASKLMHVNSMVVGNTFAMLHTWEPSGLFPVGKTFTWATIPDLANCLSNYPQSSYSLTAQLQSMEIFPTIALAMSYATSPIPWDPFGSNSLGLGQSLSLM